jgi:uncharacterized protein YjbI with pentapeptide repeats
MAESTSTREKSRSGLELDFRPADSSTRWGTQPPRAHSSYGPGSALVNWERADLGDADLRWQNFRGASLHHANLERAMLWGASLKDADLSHADLSHADLTGTDISGADMSDAKLEGTCFAGARYNQATRFPKGFGDPKNKGCTEALPISFH